MNSQTALPSLTAEEIATLVGGNVVSGNPSTSITGVASLLEAQSGDMSFYNAPRYFDDLKNTSASAVLMSHTPPMPPDSKGTPPFSGAVIAVDNPSGAFTLVLAKFTPPIPIRPSGIHSSAVVGENCEIDPTACIQAGVVIEDGVKIGARTVIFPQTFVGHGSILGDDCLIYSNVSIRERARIGNRITLHCGVVIGSDGYGYEFVEGRHRKIAQIGIVQLDNDVEIGANSTIDRARFGRTWIGEGTKVDNLVQIGHNVVIGKNSLIIAQTGIAGSTHVGNYVVIAARVGVIGHIKIGDGAMIGAQSGISKNVPPGSRWLGYFAEPAKKMQRQLAYISRLPKLVARVKALEDKLAEQNQENI